MVSITKAGNRVCVNKKELGNKGEMLAEEYLRETCGYAIIAKNYTCSLGEMDLIALDGTTLSFVEVRTTSSAAIPLAEESIGLRKQKKLRQVAACYLKEKKRFDCDCRFDVIVLVMDKKRLQTREIKLYKDAF